MAHDTNLNVKINDNEDTDVDMNVFENDGIADNTPNNNVSDNGNNNVTDDYDNNASDNRNDGVDDNSSDKHVLLDNTTYIDFRAQHTNEGHGLCIHKHEKRALYIKVVGDNGKPVKNDRIILCIYSVFKDWSEFELTSENI